MRKKIVYDLSEADINTRRLFVESHRSLFPHDSAYNIALMDAVYSADNFIITNVSRAGIPLGFFTTRRSTTSPNFYCAVTDFEIIKITTPVDSIVIGEL